MPELPEVETVCRGLDAALKNAVIQRVTLRRKDLRIPFPEGFEEKLGGVTVRRITRRAKYLLWHLDNRQVLLAHLGMSGCFIVDDGEAQLAGHDHVSMSLGDGRRVIYRDPRRFGLMTLVAAGTLKTHPLLAHLGPEPLEKVFTAAYLESVLSTRKTSIKAALMDQEVVVGVGNIYASEALFLAGMHPLVAARDAASGAPELVESIRAVLRAAIASGGSSLRDFVHISGDAGYFQHRFAVYDREGKPCQKCQKPIKNMVISGRSSFFCPECQRQRPAKPPKVKAENVSRA